MTTDKVKDVLYEMLHEKTGVHMCDSGGENGRRWQINQGVDFESQPTIEIDEIGENDTDSKDVTFSINLYHYLYPQLEVDDICEEFNRINTGSDNWDANSDIYGLSLEAEEYLLFGIKEGGAINTYDGERHYITANTFNSYNGETNLSQVIQGSYITIWDESYLVLQIHQGADVRGGYTDARLFKIGDDYDGYLAREDVYGSIDGVQVDNAWDGWSLTDDNGEAVPVNTKSVVELEMVAS